MIVSLNGRRAELPDGASVADAVEAVGRGRRNPRGRGRRRRRGRPPARMEDDEARERSGRRGAACGPGRLAHLPELASRAGERPASPAPIGGHAVRAGRTRLGLPPDRRQRRLSLAGVDGARGGRLGSRDRDRGASPRRPGRAGVGARGDRSARVVRAPQHGRLLHGARRGAHRASGARGVRDRLDQARGDRRRPHPAPRTRSS